MSPLLFALLLDVQADPPPLPAPEPTPPTEPTPDPITDPRVYQQPQPQQLPPPREPVVESEPPPTSMPDPPHRPSEGRMLVTAYNAGFQWGISPGVVFANGNAGFALGLSFGYGIDLDSVIIVPGVRLTALFTDPNVYYGMPVAKLLVPIDRFAPFIEGGGGVGYLDGSNGADGKTGAAVMGGGGFEVYFRHFAIGAEASYTAITGTSFHGIGIGPILAIGF